MCFSKNDPNVFIFLVILSDILKMRALTNISSDS